MFISALTFIPENNEITVDIDRTETTINTYRSSTRHHWQKYDYSSCLVCDCGYLKNIKSNKEQNPCQIKNLKTLIKSLKSKNKNTDSITDETTVFLLLIPGF